MRITLLSGLDVFALLKWKRQWRNRYLLIFKYSILSGETGEFARSSLSDVDMNLNYAGIDRSRSSFCFLYYCGYLRHMAQFPSLAFIAAASNERGVSLFTDAPSRRGEKSRCAAPCRAASRFFNPSYSGRNRWEGTSSSRLCASSLRYAAMARARKWGCVPLVSLDTFATINIYPKKTWVNIFD